MNIEKFIKENASIVDVRTSQEFKGGHVSGSINIPLQEIQNRVHEFKSLKTPVILCCASGNRSGIASQFLNNQGIECVNAGSWLDVNYYQSLSV
ncbi:MAG: rhodanese-like domain-containing protein [Flavobacteriaceae bacterium]|nr:rhodanese-like domain-containing protein [Flavobacteriaceae bacterium]